MRITEQEQHSGRATRVVIVMPAYRAERTLRDTYLGLPKVYSKVILCDDASGDRTTSVSRELGIATIVHTRNVGYGGNQKTLYDAACLETPDVVVMVHPDNQYDTRCIPEMIERVRRGAALVLGTRMETALRNGMPVWKYLSNRFLSKLQNRVFRTSLSEFHSGLRAYDARVLGRAPYRSFSNNFVFDSEVVAWFTANGHLIDEVRTECRYCASASSTNLRQSVRYGLSTLWVLVRYLIGRYRAT
jgi:glycosyltransferase involved in cell wall biosynthesis